MERDRKQFLSMIEPGVIALVFYAGHGVQIEGSTCMIPVEFDLEAHADEMTQKDVQLNAEKARHNLGSISPATAVL